jgi:hypothetical protein
MQITLLRLALLADAAATAATGLLMAGAATMLAQITGIPAAFSLPVGLGLVAFAAFVGWVGRRAPTSRSLAMLVVALNALWVVGSIVVLVTGLFPLTLLGTAFVIVQAVAVGALALLQQAGLVAAGRRALA